MVKNNFGLMKRESSLQVNQRKWRQRKGNLAMARNVVHDLQLNPELNREHELQEIIESLFNTLDYMNNGLFIEQGGKVK